MGVVAKNDVKNFSKLAEKQIYVDRISKLNFLNSFQVFKTGQSSERSSLDCVSLLRIQDMNFLIINHFISKCNQMNRNDKWPPKG